MPLPIGIQEWAGGAGPGHGAGLLAARLSTPGASVDDIATRDRKKMLESGSTLNSVGQLAGGAIGAGLGAALSGDTSLGGEIWNGIAGASTGALVGGVAAPAVGGWWNARRRLKEKAEEKAAPIREKNERLENMADKVAEFWATEYATMKQASLDPASLDNNGMRTRMGYYRWRAKNRLNPNARPVGPVDMGIEGENGTASPGSPNMSGTNAI